MTDFTVDSSPAEEPGVPTGSSFEVPSYTVPAEDEPYVQRVLAMDPVSDVPGPVELEGRITLPAKLTVQALPEDLRRDVQAKLASVSPNEYEETERALVLQALRANSLEARTAMGVGAGALPYHKEQVAIAAQARSLLQEFDNITEQLAKVSDFESRINEETGKAEPFPILAMTGERRAAAIARQEQINYQIKLLQGIEGERRLAKAMLETVALLKAREEQVADEAEVLRRTNEQEREARINARVAAKLRMRGAEVKG